jgi:hypothetical protein
MSIQELLKRVQSTADCEIYAPTGLPLIREEHMVPEDLHEFYNLCSGVSLYRKSPKRIRIVPPEGVAQANPLLLPGLTPGQASASANDISWSWYIIAHDYGGNYLTIDLSKQRLGRCYDSFFDRHAMPGYCPIIALSFTELLTRLIENQSEYPYWELSNFVSSGDAYDGIDYIDSSRRAL